MLALLPRGAIVVNTARGDLVDDTTLIATHETGQVAAVGLDVFAGEPDIDARYIAQPRAGVQDLVIESWNAVMAPASTPVAIQATFGDAVRSVIRGDAGREKLFSQGWVADGGSAAELQRRIAADTAMYARIITARNIKLEG